MESRRRSTVPVIATRSGESETLMDDKEAEVREWNLPDELTRLILIRLPANDLIGYKLVSKLWLSLISSPDFISDHVKRSESESSSHRILFHLKPPYPLDRCRPGSFRSLVYFLAHSVSVVGSANGLICVVANSNRSDNIWILNPVTGHIMKLPLPSKPPSDKWLDTFKDNVTFVFWWDGDCDGGGEYKLARIVAKTEYESVTQASVWVSSSPETWSEIPVGFNGAYRHATECASGCDIVVGDFAYWVVFHGIDPFGRWEPQDLFVLSLNLKTLSLSLNKTPFPLYYGRHFTTPSSLFDKLVWGFNSVLFAANREGKFVLVAVGPEMYDVWTMDDVEGWSKQCSFGFPILKVINDVNGKIVIMITVDPLECGIALYDVGKGEAEVIEDFISGHIVASAHDFVGSLVSIKGFKPLEAADDLSQHITAFWHDPSVSRWAEGGDEEEDDEGEGCVEGEDDDEGEDGNMKIYSKEVNLKFPSGCGSK